MGYPQTDIFLVCFYLVDKESFKNALNKLIPEVSKNSPNTPIVLVGTKSDLKKSYEGTEKDSEIVPTSDGLNAVQQHKLFSYVECGAKTKDNLTLVFSLRCNSISLQL